jgi:recombination protein RecT
MANELAKVTPNKAATVRDMLAKSKEQFAMALPRHIQVDRLLRVAMTSIQRTPKLLDCDPKSLMAALMQSAQLGLMPDGALGEAYLIPFKDQVQFIIGYRGLISLARRSGEIVSLAAHCVHVNDVFEFEYGLDEKLRHVPTLEDRGEMVAVYGVAKLKDGGHGIEIMSRRDVDAIRDGSQGYKAAIQYKKDHPWISHYDQMARKTVLRRLAKYLPVSVEMLEAIAVDEQNDAGRVNFSIVDNGKDMIPTKEAVSQLNERFSGETINQDTGEIEPEGESTIPELDPKVKSFMREINQNQTALAVDQWRMKHSKRVSHEFGGEEAEGYKQVMEYADVLYRDFEESEKAEA